MNKYYFRNRENLKMTIALILRSTFFLHYSMLLFLGEKASVSNGNMIRVAVGDLLQGSKWSCMLIEKDDEAKKIKVQVNIPAHAIVGRYKLTVETTSRLADGPKVERSAKPDVIVLFNPFAPG